MPPDLETWMWAEACEALARAERLQREFFRLGSPKTATNWEPPVDIFETERELCIVAALPGVAASAVEVTVTDGIIQIAGERRAAIDQQHGKIHRMEIPQGRFARRIALPSGTYELKRRDVRDGCLTLVLLKRR